MEKLKVGEEARGKRLDVFLLEQGIAPSRSKVQSWIHEGKVLWNGKKAKPHLLLTPGDVIAYEPYEAETWDVKGEDIPLNIVYEDSCLLIVNKPAGMVVHPGNGHRYGTLANALVYHEKELADDGDPLRPGIIHRIDKDTSGLLCIAKTDEAAAFLKDQLQDHTMHREYYALVKGIIEENDGKIDAPIGRDPKSPVKFAVNLHSGKEAITFFHVITRYHEGYTLISCRLLTGRTHQIRVHLNAIGHPVVGDPLYGVGNCAIYTKGQLLHAYRLSFIHPLTKKPVQFEAPIPEDFQHVLDSLHPLAS